MTNDFDFGFTFPNWAAKEKDLSTAPVESPGLTPVIIVGEFPQGPAFAPVNHRSAQAFTAVMGLRTTERLGGIPRYMAAFHAQSVLRESNDLTTVRVLGLSGYLAGPSWVITAENGVVLAVLRSRGTYVTASDPAPTFAASSVTSADMTAGTLSVLDSFTLTVTGPAGTDTHLVSLNQDRPNYLPLVLGRSAHDRTAKVFVEAVYPDTARSLFETGIIAHVRAVSAVTGDTNLLVGYQSAMTPWLVSQRQGNGVSELFRFLTIGDGNAANTQVKFTIENLDLATATFDVLVRDFADTDANPTVLERFSGLNLDPGSGQYILARMGGRFYGNTQNAYPLKSTYCLVEAMENAPVGTVPCGFEGYPQYISLPSGLVPVPARYKTALTSFDKAGKFSFGLSELAYDAVSRGRGLDSDRFRFAGVPVPTTWRLGQGFHLDSGIGIVADTAGISRFVGGPAPFTTVLDQNVATSPLLLKRNRRFTVAPAGGFDGWDIYRTERTNKDAYQPVATSDYQAWLKALNLLKNPREIPGEILITSGLNFSDQLGLVSATYDIVEQIRKDCLYIAEAPDLGGEPGSTEAVSALFDASGLQSSYGTWHTPWVQDVNTDAGNGLVYVSPAGEQARACALTDKVRAKWFAAAGMTRGAMPTIRQARRKLSDAERAVIHLSRGNAIVTFPHGLVDIFGNNTMLPTTTGSPLTSLNVRRSLLYVRRELGAIAEGLILDQQSDQQAAQSFLSQATPILERMKREQGLFSYQISQMTPDNPEAADRKRQYFRLSLQPIEALENIGFLIEVGNGAVTVAEV
jgi:hypothetical protein